MAFYFFHCFAHLAAFTLQIPFPFRMCDLWQKSRDRLIGAFGLGENFSRAFVVASSKLSLGNLEERHRDFEVSFNEFLPDRVRFLPHPLDIFRLAHTRPPPDVRD